MRQFHSPRSRNYRGQSRFRLRYAAIGVAAVAIIAAVISVWDRAPDAPTEVAAAQVTPPKTVRFVKDQPPAASYSLKSAFDAVPPAPGTSSHHADAEDAEMREAAQKMAALEPGLGGVVSDAVPTVQELVPWDAMRTSKKLSVRRGDTLMDLLVRNRVPRQQAYGAIEALRKIYDPRRLSPRHEITVFFHEDPSVADPLFQGLSIEKDVVSTVRVDVTRDGDYAAHEDEKQVRSTLRAYKGSIDGALYLAAQNAGVPDGVIIDLIRMYSWSVDFQRDIQAGDLFEVMYEEYTTEDGDIVPGRGEIIYAQMTLSGRDLPFYRHELANGDIDYFDDEGQSAKKTLMKTPIDGARLSSGYGMRRHPVLGYNKMHKGLDFAAPRGTPVYAAGDGVIRKLGRFSSYGKYIRIRHNNGLETAYAHLNGYKSGLRAGSRVKQGQVIGYVGTTGRSTGPHLHYEILRNGRQINPRSLKLPTGKKLAGAELKKFKDTASALDRKFAVALRKNGVAPVAVAAAQ
ncbi:MAG: peptidoglycan DD-metalloendopeptidase family protein [Alphaproteobacteria bacterium]|nr:peptidoglycan DD-metalloendopeptidase family protein [Alphaproteobacteria bacterium]